MEAAWLTPSQMRSMRETITVKVFTFKDMDLESRTAAFAELQHTWNQFNEVCHGGVDAKYVAKFKQAIHGKSTEEYNFEYMVVILSKRHVLGFALALEERVEYDQATLAYLKSKSAFKHDTTLNVKLLCAREDSGIGGHLINACEGLALHLKCPSVYVSSVPDAYGFYKHKGFAPFREAKYTCSPHLEGHDKFEAAVRDMAASFENNDSSENDDAKSPLALKKQYRRYITDKKNDKNGRSTVLEGIKASRYVNPQIIVRWTLTKHRNWLNTELDKIVTQVFSPGGAYADTIKMSKCLVPAVDDSETETDSDAPPSRRRRRHET